MNKLVAIGATAMMGMTSLGMTQVVTHAAEKDASPAPYTSMIKNLSQAKLGAVQTQQAADTDVVSIPDATFKAAIKTKFKIAANDDITVADMKKLTDIDNRQGLPLTGVKDLTGIEYAENLVNLNVYGATNVKGLTLPTNLNKLTKLGTIGLNGCGIDNNFVKNLGSLPAGTITKYLQMNNGFITDLSPLKQTVKAGANIQYALDGQSVTETAQTALHGDLTLNVKDIKNIDGSTPTITPANGGVLSKDGKTITWKGLAASTKAVSYSWAGKNSFSGKVTVPVTVTDKQQDHSADVKVEYTTTVTSSDPTWYGVVPSAITFNDQTKAVDANVQLSKDPAKYDAYDGSKTVDVTVKSANGFKLKDGAKADVAYQMKKDGAAAALNADTSVQALGSLSKGATEIKSKATVTGTAKDSGKYTDTLTYNFSEK